MKKFLCVLAVTALLGGCAQKKEMPPPPPAPISGTSSDAMEMLAAHQMVETTPAPKVTERAAYEAARDAFETAREVHKAAADTAREVHKAAADTAREVNEAARMRATGLVRLYYATDRHWTGATVQPKWFGPDWNSEAEHLTYGTCNVSIPIAVHDPGVVEKPSIFRLELSENPDKHVVVFKPEQLAQSAFFQALGEEVHQRREKEIVIFIHGFNNTFDDAASRLGVLAYDMEFAGVPVLYSWSSVGGGFWGTRDYPHDSEVIESTKRPLTNFLAAVAQTGRDAGARRVNIIAHSMGNRALVAALQALAERNASRMLFDEVVMAAPDVREQGFATDEWPRMQGPARRVTLYASSDDRALKASQRLNHFRRIGEAGNDLLLLPGLDTIDATGCDFSRFGLNHSYFGGPRVMGDLRLLIHKGLTPAERRLRQLRRGQFPYWLLPTLSGL